MSFARPVGPQHAGRRHLGRRGLPGVEVRRLELGERPAAGAGADDGAAKNSITRSGSPDP